MIVGYCKYCNFYAELKVVQLKCGKEWQTPIKICTDCRKYLKGLFRYIKEKKNEKHTNK